MKTSWWESKCRYGASWRRTLGKRDQLADIYQSVKKTASCKFSIVISELFTVLVKGKRDASCRLACWSPFPHLSTYLLALSIEYKNYASCRCNLLYYLMIPVLLVYLLSMSSRHSHPINLFFLFFFSNILSKNNCNNIF